MQMFVFVLLCLFSLSREERFPAKYHDYNDMTLYLTDLARNYSRFATLYSIGQSVGKKELWVLKIRSPLCPAQGAPHVKFVGNIHGNEPVGKELILYFAEYLLSHYKSVEEVKWLLDKTVIHLLPSLNPDGFERSREGDCYSASGRENGNFVDLNRSFPDKFSENKVPAQPETVAVAQWMSQVPFVLSASFHGGALVANYPYDSLAGSDFQELHERVMKNISEWGDLKGIWKNLTPKEQDSILSQSSLSPDDDVFKFLARTYSINHLTMHKGRLCSPNQPPFPGGITNGAAWYSFSGGMQDYCYLSHGCLELTLEISCCKYPETQHLPRLWNENKKAMKELIKQAHVGVRGIVMDKVTSASIPGAILHVDDRNVSFTSSKNGEFWRILLPQDYILNVKANGYESQSFPFTVHVTDPGNPTATWLNIYLQPLDGMLVSASSNVAQKVENSGTFLPLSPYLCFSPFLVLGVTWINFL